MGTLTWLLVGVAIGLASPFLLIHVQRRIDVARAGVPRVQAARDHRVRPSNPFAAVSISADAESPCAAVLQLAHRRFLAVRAPPLPVAGCDRNRCGCRYIRHADRRVPGDRRDVFAQFGGLLPRAGKERRAAGPDRRQGTRDVA